MPRFLKGNILENTLFTFPWRMILSGSSESGKTFFAKKLLEKQNIFHETVSSVLYCFPCFIETTPVNWHAELTIPVSYQIGLPSKKQLLALPTNSCVVLDDLYDEAIKSEAIDHLFRVISGKKRLCVMIMTQNNFTKGKYGRDIRNSCNFTVLFRNCCDSNINKRVTAMAGLRMAFEAAENDYQGNKYPYIFIDQSQQGQISSFRLYTDIFNRFKIVWSVTGMKGYVITESDFLSVYSVLENAAEFSAVENDNPKQYKTSQSKDPAIVPEEIQISSTDEDIQESQADNFSENNITEISRKSNHDSELSTESQKIFNSELCEISENNERCRKSNIYNNREAQEQNEVIEKHYPESDEKRKPRKFTTRNRIRSRYRKRFRDSIFQN